jgi:enoyl-CoA hydratase/carnithine racemase
VRAPDATEAFSPLTGAPALVLDLRAGRAPTGPGPADAWARLRTLPSPTIALLADAAQAADLPPALRAVAAAVDVVVTSAAALDAMLATIAAAPLASMTLVQLLRQPLGDVALGLVRESLAYATLQGGPELARWLAARPPAPPDAAGREPVVLVTRADARLELVLNRPARHNAFSARMRDALAEPLQLAAADATIATIVLRGTGPSFCSGGDLAEFGSRADPAAAHAIRVTRNVGRLLADCAPRVRAEIHGACVGAGIELPAFARRVIAAPDTFVQLPEVGMGLVPGAGGTVSLPRRIGRQRTAWLALSGTRIDAETALAWGLVDEIASSGGRAQPRAART